MRSPAELIAAFQKGEIHLEDVLEGLDAYGSFSDSERVQALQGIEHLATGKRAHRATVRALKRAVYDLRSREAEAASTVVKRPGAEKAEPEGPISREETGSSRGDHRRAPEASEYAADQRLSRADGTHSQWVARSEGEAGVRVDSVIKERFYLVKQIGRGGMGVVFKARDMRKVEAHDRDPYIAVKVISDDFRRNPNALIALQREARRTQQLAHDNIVNVYDFDKDKDTVFMTMEYIRGCDLQCWIRKNPYTGVPFAQAWPLIEGMSRALARAHRSGMVHSDFKPANVMITESGVPKVLDFGIARAAKYEKDPGAESDMTVFDAGTLGALTPAYASLEMMQGKEPEPSDDIYALGCVIFELLTGKHPFGRANAESALREGLRPPPVDGLSGRQYRTLTSCVALRRELRLDSVEAVLHGLRHADWRARILNYFL